MTPFRCRWLGGLCLLLSACATTPTQGSVDTVSFDVLLRKGDAYLHRGNPQMALLALERAEKLKPDHLGLLTRLGVAYDQTDQTGRALAVWRHAHALAPSQGAISHNLGVALMRLESLEEAEQAFDEALQDSTFLDQDETCYNMALIHQRRGDHRAMEAWLQKALLLEPDHLPAHRLLAEHYREMRRPDLEEKHLRHILTVAPKDLPSLERLVLLYLQSGPQAGRRGLAEPLLRRIEAAAPGSDSAQKAALQRRALEAEKGGRTRP